MNTGHACACAEGLLSVVICLAVIPATHGSGGAGSGTAAEAAKREGGPSGQVGWAQYAKTVTVRDLQRRCRFTTWIPEGPPAGYTFVKAQITWVPRSPLFPGLPARQAVCIEYRRSSPDGHIWVIEVGEVPGRRWQSVRQVEAEGYFVIPQLAGPRSFHFGARPGVDLLIVGVPPVEDDEQVIRSVLRLDRR
jgi:hypothetical protein